jgi:hypothetical protein
VVAWEGEEVEEEEGCLEGERSVDERGEEEKREAAEPLLRPIERSIGEAVSRGEPGTTQGKVRRVRRDRVVQRWERETAGELRRFRDRRVAPAKAVEA